VPTIQHNKPTESPADRVRVIFELEDNDLGEAEALWGRWVTRETVQLDNIPLLVFGLSMGDLIQVRRDGETLRLAAVAERGGHSTYRVMLHDADDSSARERLREMITLGCGYEHLTPRFLALDVPPDVDVFKVYDLLENGLEQGVWTFEEGHCGHPLDTELS
jgi:hypothetical protein